MNKHYIDESVRNFKNDLVKCHYNNAKLIKLNEKLIEVEVRLFEVSATTYEEKTGVPDSRKTPKIHEIQVWEDLRREVAKLRLHFDKMSYLLGKLDEDTRKAVLYRYIYEMDMTETAQVMGMPRRSLYRLIDRGISELFKEG